MMDPMSRFLKWIKGFGDRRVGSEDPQIGGTGRNLDGNPMVDGNPMIELEASVPYYVYNSRAGALTRSISY